MVYGLSPSPGGAWANYDGSYEYALGGYGPGGYCPPGMGDPYAYYGGYGSSGGYGSYGAYGGAGYGGYASYNGPAIAFMAAAATAAVTPGSITATASPASGPGVPMRAFQRARRLA